MGREEEDARISPFRGGLSRLAQAYGDLPLAGAMAERAYERYAWTILLALGIVFALFGVGDMALGTAADPAIVEGVAGMTPKEIGDMDPALLRLVNQQTRAGGSFLLIGGLLIAAIAATSFRRGERWAWYALWTLPLLNVLIFLNMYMSLDPASDVLPPPLLSAPIALAISVVGLLLPVRRFFPKAG